MLVFIVLNMTPFYVERRMSQMCPKGPMCCPNAPHTGVHWDIFFSDSLNGKYLQMYSRSTGLREPQK